MPSAPQIHCSEAEALHRGDAGFIADELHPVIGVVPAIEACDAIEIAEKIDA
jgi:hypothetical protein